MDNLEFKNYLHDTLATIRPVNFAHNQVTIRCPFCGDSTKHNDSTHFGVKINFRDPDEPVIYHCFLCHESGVMTSEVLHALDVHDLQATTALGHFNKSIMGNIKRMGFRENHLELKVPNPELHDRNGIKKLYIEQRIGREFTYDELRELKVIFSLKQFCDVNEIDRINCSKEKAIELENNYVGFLTVRNEKINFRQVLESPYKRYEKYEVYKALDNTQKFYAIPTTLDILSTDPIYLVISEGVFDILGAYYHVFKERTHNIIYAAACGSGFVNVVKYFLRKGLFVDVRLIIISDNEPHRTLPFYRKDLAPILNWVDETEIYYNCAIDPNTGNEEKDFGVPSYRIKVKKNKL